MYNRDITTLIRCPEGKTLIEIPNSVTSIGDYAFCNSKLMSVEIPNSVTSIGKAAFIYSTNLTLVEFPNSVTLIGKEAFRDCSSITSIIIPKSVIEIGSSAFYGCTGLTLIEIKAQNPLTIDVYTFYKVSRFVQIKVPCGSKEKYQTAEYWWEFMNYEEFSPELTVGVNDETMGFAVVIKQNSCDDAVAQVQAQALSGYKFVRWSDGSTDNPHIVLVTEDMTLTAEFAKEEEDVDVEDAIITSAEVYTRDGVLHVEGAETDYYVLDTAGRLIYSGRDAELRLPRGVYVVNVGGEVQKVVI